MSMSGWIKIHRKIVDNPIWTSEKFTDGQAWVDLLLIANHNKGIIKVRGIRIKIPPGSLGWSEKKLAERWGWSRGKVRRFLNYLCSENMIKIEQQKKNVTSIISIINYSQYQDNNTTNDTTDGQQTIQQTDTNKNNKEENKNNKEYILSDSFEKFFDLYHKISGLPKTDKQAAFKYWKKLTMKEREKAIENIKPYINSISDKKYIKKARTYLADKNFNDEFVSISTIYRLPENPTKPLE